jgi:3-hydroxyisobutyrate dehydrogenase-like beta-hydroxyacid dehydrogenase
VLDDQSGGMERTTALIGFGEAAMAFAPGLSGVLTAYDRKTDDPALADDKRDDYGVVGLRGCDSAAAALDGADAALSLVTADQALLAAEGAAIAPGTFWFDMNSVAPDTKRAAAAAITAKGGRYVDVAVMSPVLPARTGVPLLVSGPPAEAGAAYLTALGFGSVRIVPGDVGRASSIKMIRSVMVKGIEARTRCSPRLMRATSRSRGANAPTIISTGCSRTAHAAPPRWRRWSRPSTRSAPAPR